MRGEPRRLSDGGCVTARAARRTVRPDLCRAADAERANDDDNDYDSTAQRDDKSSDEYEARLNSLVPPTQYFCCRLVFF